MSAQNNTGVSTDCIYPKNKPNIASILTQADSYDANGVKGALFEGMPNSFICLNEFPNYLDSYNNTYTHNSTCPFDPTNPPSVRYVIGGTITYNGTAIPDDNVNFTSSIAINTSDGPGNCLKTPFIASGNTYIATYECDVYDGINKITDGWTGYIQPTYTTGMACTPNPRNFTDVTGDISNQDFTCAEGALGKWTGTVTQVGTGSDAPKIISNAFLTGTGSSDGIDGTCAIASDGKSYTCTSSPFTGTWTGDISFKSAGGAICPYVSTAVTTKTYALTNQVNETTGNNPPINLVIGRDNGNGCVP
jgi:hypothetical protein